MSIVRSQGAFALAPVSVSVVGLPRPLSAPLWMLPGGV